jgi:hypothetical protein
MYANAVDTNGVAMFDPTANFIRSENTCNFSNHKKTQLTDKEKNKFWIERFNFYRPNASSVNATDGYDKDLTDKITPEQKHNLFNHIVKLYDNLTGSSLSPFLYFTEENIILYMWKKYGDTETEYGARNIITDGMPVLDDTDGKNAKLEVKGIYYKDGNGDWDIYTENKKNYTKFISYNDGILTWGWQESDTVYGEDTFILDDTFDFDTSEFDSNSLMLIKGAIGMKNSYDVIKSIEVVLNRLPKTFKKSPTSLKTLYSDSKVLLRLNNLTNPISLHKVSSEKITSNNALIKKNTLQQSLIKANKIAARTSFDVKAVKSATMNQIEPKIQAAYGFTDFGKILKLNMDGDLSMDDGSFVTTHKIGYEENDRYRIGEASCDSYLFLSPLNHSEIQVSGDTPRSCTTIKPNESLVVPIVYQYRMEDYNGNIFGRSGYKSSDAIVKNTKFANIIGIDIWMNTLSDTPKQYDIIVYSSYNKDNTRAVSMTTKKLK